MSDPGHGPPVDALDTVCKAYKDCVKCARIEYGDMCIGEFVKYRYGYKNGAPVCKDSANTCDRALCECDAKFAKEHVGAKDVFDIKYHMFWSTTEVILKFGKFEKLFKNFGNLKNHYSKLWIFK